MRASASDWACVESLTASLATSLPVPGRIPAESLRASLSFPFTRVEMSEPVHVAKKSQAPQPIAFGRSARIDHCIGTMIHCPSLKF